MIELPRNSESNTYCEKERRLTRLKSTLELGLERKISANQLLPTQAPGTSNLTNGKMTVSKKAGHYFANMFSPFGAVEAVDANSPSASPRFSVANVTSFCTYVLSDKKDTAQRISRTYTEAAQLIVDNTLTLQEKMSRIAIYLGALILILNTKVCHGDLKPENILWDDDRFVMSDFNGSILIEDVFELMNPEFKLESEEYKEKLREVVTAFKNSRNIENACREYPNQFKKLIKWKIVNDVPEVIDKEKLDKLSSYLRTKYFPDHTKGYASIQYLKKMGDYFWQGDRVNYENAAQAFDIRAAGLTIYSILTGARTPLQEDDTAYYDMLEHSLSALGIDPRAVSLIRHMAEPSVKRFGKDFTMPVTIDELEELEQIFANKPIVAIPDADSPEPGVASDSVTTKQQLKATLDNVTEAIERLSLIEGDDDDSVKENAMKNLINALTNDDITVLRGKLQPNEQINAIVRKRLIQEAFKKFPASCEMTLTIDGQQHLALLLLDKNSLHRCDVLLKKERIGDGASAVAFKALSLRSLSYVVVKYSQEFADPQELERSQQILGQIGSHAGVQSVTAPFTLTTAEGDKTVVIDAFYKKRDYGAAVHGEILCLRLGILREEWCSYESVKASLNVLNKNLVQVLVARGEVAEKHSRLKSFIEEYGNSLIAILGVHKGKQLLEDYNSLITDALPVPAAAPLESPKGDEKKSPRVFSSVKDLLPFSPKSPRPTRGSPRQSTSRRSSIASRAESLSWIETDPDSLGVPAEIEATIEVINVKALEMLLQDPNFDNRYRAEIVENARKITLKAIRDCQRLILQEYLQLHSDPLLDVNPAKESRKWRKQAETMGSVHLDVKGINHISKLVGVDAAVQVDEGIRRQKTLSQLLDIQAQVWKIAKE